MILTFQLPPNEVAQSTSEVDFLSSYLNQTTSEENVRTQHTRIPAREDFRSLSPFAARYSLLQKKSSKTQRDDIVSFKKLLPGSNKNGR